MGESQRKITKGHVPPLKLPRGVQIRPDGMLDVAVVAPSIVGLDGRIVITTAFMGKVQQTTLLAHEVAIHASLVKLGWIPPADDEVECIDVYRLHSAAKAFLDDVRRRHPGEDFICPFIRELDEATKLVKIPKEEDHLP